MATSAIGVDPGSDTLKAARLSLHNGGLALTGLGLMPLGELGHLPESPDRRLAVSAKLQQMIRDAGLRTGLLSPAKVNFGLAGAKVSFRFLQTIPVPRMLLEKKVAFEVSENITAKSKVALSYNYRILDTPQQDQTNALIGLAVESEVEAVRIECRQAQLADPSIDFSVLGLYNAYAYGHGPCFRAAPAQPDAPPVNHEAPDIDALPATPVDAPEGPVSTPETVAIVDIGASEIKILVCHGDDLYFIKANGGGGLRFSQSLAKLLNVNLFEAEAAKCEDADVNIDGHSGNTLRLTRPGLTRGPAASAAALTTTADTPAEAEAGAGADQDAETAAAEAPDDSAAAGADTTTDPAAAEDTGASWLDDAAGEDDAGADSLEPPAVAPTAHLTDKRNTVIVENPHAADPASPGAAGASDAAAGRGRINYGRQGEPGGSGARGAIGPAGSGITTAPGSEAVPGPVSLTTASGASLIDPAALDSGESILNAEPPAEKLVAPEDPTAVQQRQRRISNLLVREAAAICANIESAVQFCRQQNRLRQLRLDRVLITGGGARLKGLAGYMQRRMRLPVENLDPFRNIQVTLPPAQFEQLKTERDRLAVPIGLAVGVLIPAAAHLPLVTAAEAARKRLVQRTLYLYYAAALTVAVVVLGFFFTTRRNDAYADYYQQVQTAYHNAVLAQQSLETKERDLELIRRETNAVELRVNSGTFIADLLTTLKSKEITQDNIWFTEIATVAPDFIEREELKREYGLDDAVMNALAEIHSNAHLLRDKRLFLRGFCKSTANPDVAYKEATDNILRMAHKLSKEQAATPAEREAAIFDEAWVIYTASANAKDLPKTSKNMLIMEFVVECRLYERKSVVMEKSVLPPEVGSAGAAGSSNAPNQPAPPPAGPNNGLAPPAKSKFHAE